MSSSNSSPRAAEPPPEAPPPDSSAHEGVGGGAGTGRRSAGARAGTRRRPGRRASAARCRRSRSSSARSPACPVHLRVRRLPFDVHLRALAQVLPRDLRQPPEHAPRGATRYAPAARRSARRASSRWSPRAGSPPSMPEGMARVSGSAPRLPMRMTLLIPRAMVNVLRLWRTLARDRPDGEQRRRPGSILEEACRRCEPHFGCESAGSRARALPLRCAHVQKG